MTTVNMVGREFAQNGSYVDLSESSTNLAEMWYFNCPIDNLTPNMLLVVKFQSGGYYAYGGVTAPLWQFILDGKTAKSTGNPFSIGAAFREEVILKSDIYPYIKLSDEQVKEILG